MMKGWQITVLAAGLAAGLGLAAPGGEEPATPPALGAARAALEDGLYDLAERQLQSIVASVDRGSAAGQEAIVLLARALHGQGRYREVLALVNQSSGKGRPPLSAGLVFWRAMACYDLAQYDAALADVRDFGTHFPGDLNVTRAARLAAWCQLKAGRTKEALDAFEAFDRAYGPTPAGLGNLLDWGQALLAVGRAGDAAATFERLATRAPDSGEGQEARLALSQALIQQGHWEAAWNLLSLAASDASVRVDRRTRAWLALGDLNAVRTNYEASVAAAVKAFELAPTGLLKNRALAMQGRWLIKLGKLEEGVAQLRTVVAAQPRDPLAGDLQLELAAAFQEAKQYQKSEDEYQRYLETFTDPAGQYRALKGRAWSLWYLGRYAESGAVFEKAAAAAPSEGEKESCLLKAADSAFANGQYKAAGEAYERVLMQFSRTALAPQTLFQLAESLGRQNQWPAAEARFRSLAREFPEHPLAERALMRIAELKEAQGPAGMRDALAAYAEVMAIYTNGSFFAEALHRHGLVAYQLLQFDQALRDFTRVVNEYGDSRVAPQAFFYRGWSLYMMGREEEAVAVCRAFVKRYPDTEWTPRVIFWLGEYAFNHGQFAEAETNFTFLAETYPKDVMADQALLWAGRAAASRKEYLRAVDRFVVAARTYPDSPHMDAIRFSQGDALTELGEFSQAIVVFDDLINKYPDSALVPAAWGRRGDCQLTLGLGDPRRYEEAIGSYRAVLNGAAAALDLKLQAEYKIGRCLEKLGRRKEAFEQYYTRVVCRYLDEASANEPPAGAAVWFTKAAFSAADLLEADKDWRRAVRVLERVTSAGVSASGDAQARIKRIRAEHWIP